MSKGYTFSDSLLHEGGYGPASTLNAHDIVLSLIQLKTLAFFPAITLKNILLCLTLSGAIYHFGLNLAAKKLESLDYGDAKTFFFPILLTVQLLRLGGILYVLSDLFNPTKCGITEVKEGPFDVSVLFAFYIDYHNTFSLKDSQYLDLIISDFLCNFPECNFITKLHDYIQLLFVFLISYFIHVFAKINFSNVSVFSFLENTMPENLTEEYKGNKEIDLFKEIPNFNKSTIKTDVIKNFFSIIGEIDKDFNQRMGVMTIPFKKHAKEVKQSDYTVLALILVIAVFIAVFYESIVKMFTERNRMQGGILKKAVITGGEVYSSSQISTFIKKNGLSSFGNDFVFEDLCENQDRSYNENIEYFVDDNPWVLMTASAVFYVLLVVWFFYAFILSGMIILKYFKFFTIVLCFDKFQYVKERFELWENSAESCTLVEYLKKEKKKMDSDSYYVKEEKNMIDCVLLHQKKINELFYHLLKNKANEKNIKNDITNTTFKKEYNIHDLKQKIENYETISTQIEKQTKNLELLKNNFDKKRMNDLYEKLKNEKKKMDDMFNKYQNIPEDALKKKDDIFNKIQQMIQKMDEIYSKMETSFLSKFSSMFTTKKEGDNNFSVIGLLGKIFSQKKKDWSFQSSGEFDKMQADVNSLIEKNADYFQKLDEDFQEILKVEQEITTLKANQSGEHAAKNKKLIYDKFQLDLFLLIVNCFLNDIDQLYHKVISFKKLTGKRYSFLIFMLAFFVCVGVQILETQHVKKGILHACIIFLSIALYSNNDHLSRYILQVLFVVAMTCIILLYIEYYTKFDDFVEDMDDKMHKLREQSIQLHVENEEDYGQLMEVRYDIGRIGFNDRTLIEDISVEFDMTDRIFKFKSNGKYLVPDNTAQNQMDKDILELFAAGNVQWSAGFTEEVLSLLPHKYSVTEVESAYERIRKILHCNKYILTGSSGSGKTTLIDILTMNSYKHMSNINYCFANDGQIKSYRYEDLPFVQKNWIQYMEQAPIKTTFIPIKFADLVKLSGKSEQEVNDLVNLLDLPVDMNEKLSYQSSFLSGGEIARLSFVMNWIMRGNKKLLVIDEFDASIDSNNVNKIINLIQDIPEAILLISHHLDNFKGVNYIQIKLQNKSITLIHHAKKT